MSAFAELHARLQKPRPRVLDREDRKRAEDAAYKRNAAIARKRDKHCRICGSHFNLSTHHVIPRSRARRSKEKHAVDRLLTV
jgi:5-methylcytosine-specific restriction endonuclease McrA